MKRLKACWQLIRPFTLLPPFVGIISGALISIGAHAHRNNISFAEEIKAKGFRTTLNFIILGAVAAVVINAFSNVVNQIFDIENDKINKPSRPLAAGDMTTKGALMMAVILFIVGMLLAFSVSPKGSCEFFSIALIAIFFTFLYSAPPLRLKRILFLSNLTISIPRGFLLITAGWTTVYRTVRNFHGDITLDVEPFYLGLPFFFYIFGACTTKDFADVPGDRETKCITFPVKYGVKKTVKIISPFFIFPWIFLPVGIALNKFQIVFISADLTSLFILAIIISLYGLFVSYLMLKEPEKLNLPEKHSAWTHMYIMMMISQLGLMVVYIF